MEAPATCFVVAASGQIETAEVGTPSPPPPLPPPAPPAPACPAPGRPRALSSGCLPMRGPAPTARERAQGADPGGWRRARAAAPGGAAQIDHCDNAYCKYSVVHGEDWQVLEGLEDGISQITRRGGGGEPLVWNFPVEVAFKATNPFGWPQLVLSVYGMDALGRDVIKGYGSVHFPVAPGSYALKVRLFKPVSSSLLQQFLGRLMGMPPEFVDPKLPSRGDGREVTRVESTGHVIVKVNIMTKDMDRLGYETAGPQTSRDLVVVQT